MKCKLPDGSVMLCGGCSKNAELERVGEKQSRICKVGIAVGKKQDPDGGPDPVTSWANVVAWHDLAEVLSMARKGDPVFVIGHLKSREYNGKTYTDVVADFVSVASVRDGEVVMEALPLEQAFAPLGDMEDGDLPF